jgi:hypothetical protein
MSELPLRPVSGLLRTAALVLLLTTGSAWATADGPDFFRVTGVSGNDVLNIRAEPRAHAKKTAEMPQDGTCVHNLGCQGGLTFQEFTNLSEAQKAERLKENPRCCRVEYQGVQGWGAGRCLQEGVCKLRPSAPPLSFHTWLAYVGVTASSSCSGWVTATKVGARPRAALWPTIKSPRADVACRWSRAKGTTQAWAMLGTRNAAWQRGPSRLRQ